MEKHNYLNTDTDITNEKFFGSEDDATTVFKIENKTQAEFTKLVEDNENFAYFIVEKEYGKYSAQIKEDLKSAAISGLIKAATKYDLSRKSECKFISYAVHWVRYFIQEELRKISPIKLNQSFVIKRNRIMKFIENYKNDHNDQEPTHEEIATELKVSKKIVDNCLALNEGKNYSFIQFTHPMNMDNSSNALNESYTENKIVKEYLDANYITNGDQLKYEVKDMLEQLKKQIDSKTFNVFYSYYFNNMNYTELKNKYKYKSISEVSNLIKDCEKKCKALITD